MFRGGIPVDGRTWLTIFFFSYCSPSAPLCGLNSHRSSLMITPPSFTFFLFHYLLTKYWFTIPEETHFPTFLPGLPMNSSFSLRTFPFSTPFPTSFSNCVSILDSQLYVLLSSPFVPYCYRQRCFCCPFTFLHIVFTVLSAGLCKDFPPALEYECNCLTPFTGPNRQRLNVIFPPLKLTYVSVLYANSVSTLRLYPLEIGQSPDFLLWGSCPSTLYLTYMHFYENR